MAYPFVTVHPTAYGDEMPLPVREAQISATSGHAVRLADWALLVEMEMERLSNGIAEQADAYPDGFVIPSYRAYYGKLHPFQAVNYLSLGGTTGSDNILRSSTFIDLGWNFATEYYTSSYNLFDRLHGQPLVMTAMTNRKPRRLDDLRRRFYDLKRCTRTTIPFRHITLTEDWNKGFGYNNSSITPRQYTWDYGSCGTLSVNLDAYLPTEVRTHENFRATPKYVLGYYRIFDEDQDVDKYRTVWLPVSAAGVVDTTAIEVNACRAVYEEELGAGPHGDGDSWVGGYIFIENGIRAHYVVVYDFRYPYDGVLVPWNWQPT